MKCLWLGVVFFCVWKAHTCYDIFNDTKEPNNFDELKVNIMGLASSVAEWVFPAVLKVTTESNVSASCSLSLKHFSTDFKELREWALKMFDASAKPPAGILYGRVIMFGDYDECSDVVAMSAEGKLLFEGNYCMVKVELPDFLPRETNQSNNTMIAVTPLWKSWIQLRTLSNGVRSFRFGLCVPSTCTAQEINHILRVVTRSFRLTTNVSCEAKVKRGPNVEQIVILYIFALFGLLVVTGTSYDLLLKQHTYFKKKSGDIRKLLTAFSFYSNTVRLFRTNEKDTTLTAVRGCRVLSAFWIVTGHVYAFPNDFHLAKYSRFTDALKFLENLMFKTVINVSLAIDTFFVLSGMLFVYTTWRDLETKGWINPVIYLPSRIARVLLIEMLVIALFMILPLFGDGPIWDETFKEPYNACLNNWWTNLLFIQNYWPVKQTCLIHTWFIGALFQLNVLTFGVPLFVHRWPKIGISINVLLILIGCFVIAFLTFSYDLPATLSDFVDHTDTWRKYVSVIHLASYTYLGSYCIGIFLCYAVVTKRNLKIKPCILAISWLLATCGVLAVLYGNHFLHLRYNRVLYIIYAALHRIVWSSCVSWLLFTCVVGYGGIIGRLLSWKGMIPLDRLSFLIYLLHPLVLYYQTARTRAVIFMGYFEQINIMLVTIVLTLCLSYLCNVTVEQPLNYLHLFVFNKFSKKGPQCISDTNIAISNRNQLTSFSLNSIASVESTMEEYSATKL